MDILSMILIPIGLAMDSFAVSIASGAILKRFKIQEVLRVALLMGIFQALLFCAGYLLGFSFRNFVSDWSHWIVFGLLTLLGGRMIYEGFKHESNRQFNPLNILVIISLAVATSIDASAVGISIAVVDFVLWKPMISIGLTAFTFSIIGVYLGEHFSNSRKIRVEWLGGIILIGIGVKELIQFYIDG